MGAISILGVGHCPMQRFMNSELREMECAGRRASRSPPPPDGLLSREQQTLWGGWFECDVGSIAKTLHQQVQRTNPTYSACNSPAVASGRQPSP